MADVQSTLAAWSSTTNSNSPSGATNIATGLDDNLREIQGVVVRGLSHKGSDIASATAPAIGAVEGLMHDITGAATITGFDTVRAGIWKILKFEGAAVLTHNATSLILPGGANITAANGDIGIFMSEGSGNWRCVTYFRAANQPTQDSSATVKGVVELATDAETLAGTDTARATTPANIKSVLGLTKLNSGAASGATLDIVMTSYTGYRNKLIVLDSFLPATDAVTLNMRFSTDGGSNYDAGASDYKWNSFGSDSLAVGTLTGNDDDSDAQMILAISGAANIGNQATEGISATIFLPHTTSTTLWPRATWDVVYLSANAAIEIVRACGAGARVAAQDTDAVRFLFSAGNITSGNWTLYGYN